MQDRLRLQALRGDEVLREQQRQFSDSTFVFAIERGGPFTPIKRIGARARFAFPVHAHMLRHACGYALAQMLPRDPAHPGLARPSIGRAHDQIHAIERGAVEGLPAIANKQQLPGASA